MVSQGEIEIGDIMVEFVSLEYDVRITENKKIIQRVVDRCVERGIKFNFEGIGNEKYIVIMKIGSYINGDFKNISDIE